MKIAKLIFCLAWLSPTWLMAQEAKVTPLLSKDLADLPELIKTEMKLHWVEQMDEVLEIALAGKLPKLAEETPDALAKTMAVPPASVPRFMTPVALPASGSKMRKPVL